MVRNFARSALGQLTEEPKEIVKEAVSQVMAPEEAGIEQPAQQVSSQKTPVQRAQDQQIAKRKLSDLEQEMDVLRQKRGKQLQERKEVPVEEKKMQQITMVQKQEEAPVIAAAKQRASAERRLKGASG